MSQPMNPISILPFVGILASSEVSIAMITETAQELLGGTSSISNMLEFDMTDYYTAEMGKELVRLWIVADYLATPDLLVSLKWRAYRIEQEHLRPDDTRTLNLDPGYIAPSKVVLATFKDFSHRLYLGRMVYGQLELMFKNDTFTPLQWTYPDYRRNETIKFMNQIRKKAFF